MRKNPSSELVAILVIGLYVPVLTFGQSAQAWQGNQNSHFAIYTASKSASGERSLLARLEAARIFFQQTGLSSAVRRLNILAIDESNAADVYRVNPSAYAFYQRTREGDFVVMRDMASEHYTVAIHEYTHFVMEHAGLKLPLWLNEGLADLYSTIESRNAQVVLGLSPSGRERSLSDPHWIDWETLARVDHNSPYYRQSGKMLLFYAQSWAMVHMLALDSRYEPGFQKFLSAVSAGANADEAMMAVYHQSLEQIGAEVRPYVNSKRMAARVLDIDVRPASLETEAIGDAGKRVELALAEIIAASPQLAQEANGRLALLAAKYPDDPMPEETLGFQAMASGRMKEAAEHFDVAVHHNSQNPEVWFRLAHLKLQLQGASPEVVDLLQRVMLADSGHYGARLELGFAAARLEQYELAVKALEGLPHLKAEHAYTVTYTLAYCLVSLQQGDRARGYAEQARKIAASQQDRDEAAGLLRYIEQESPAVLGSR